MNHLIKPPPVSRVGGFTMPCSHFAISTLQFVTLQVLNYFMKPCLLSSSCIKCVFLLAMSVNASTLVAFSRQHQKG